MSTVEYQQT